MNRFGRVGLVQQQMDDFATQNPTYRCSVCVFLLQRLGFVYSSFWIGGMVTVSWLQVARMRSLAHRKRDVDLGDWMGRVG